MIRVLFLIEDTSYCYDSRVQREAHTLKKLGVEAIVICPVTTLAKAAYHVDEGIHVYPYYLKNQSSGFSSHLREYVFSLTRQFYLAAKVFIKHGFAVVHVGNHSELFWLVALPYKLIGKRFVYDQHDPIPELFEVRFGQKFPYIGRLVRIFEKCGIALADHVITINATCQASVLGKVDKAVDRVTIVRNGPRQSDFDLPGIGPDPKIRSLSRIVVGYLGHMNAQDNVDIFMEMARIIRLEEKRTDIAFVMVGSGDERHRLQALRDQFGLTKAVVMPGRVPWKKALAILKAVDICVQPDLPNAFNHKVTMNKLMEYMMLGKPVVAFRLKETLISGGDAVVYCTPTTAAGMANQVIALADDASRRRALGLAGRRRIDDKLGWQHQEAALASVYQKLFPGLRAVSARP